MSAMNVLRSNAPKVFSKNVFVPREDKDTREREDDMITGELQRRRPIDGGTLSCRGDVDLYVCYTSIDARGLRQDHHVK